MLTKILSKVYSKDNKKNKYILFKKKSAELPKIQEQAVMLAKI